jgi:glycerol-3-phosphate dehydrogenase
LSGASIARDCAMRRLSVLVVEKDEIGGGWTDISTGLLLPDLSLLQRDRDQMHALCSEVGVLLQTAPNLLEHMPVLYPIQRDVPLGERVKISALLRTYDRFRSWKASHPHTELNSHHLPLLDAGLDRQLHSVMAWDEWRLDPGRLCSKVLKGAESCGAIIAMATAEKLQIHNRRVAGVWVKVGNQSRLVRARAVVNAAGIEVRRFYPPHSALHKGKYQAGITLFWERRLGTYAVSLSSITSADARRTEETFLPEGLHHALGPLQFDLPSADIPANLPQMAFEKALEILTPFYPAIAQHRILNHRSAVCWQPQASSENSYFDHGTEKVEGLISVLAHPILESRLVAEQVTNRITAFLRHKEVCRTHLEMLSGSVSELAPSEISQDSQSWDTLSLTRLIRRYGHHAYGIVDLVQKHPELGAIVCECEQITAAEILHSHHNEWATTSAAVSLRTGLGRGNCDGGRCLPWARMLIGDKSTAPSAPFRPMHASQLAAREYAEMLAGFGEPT